MKKVLLKLFLRSIQDIRKNNTHKGTYYQSQTCSFFHFRKKFQKTLDKRSDFCYNIIAVN